MEGFKVLEGSCRPRCLKRCSSSSSRNNVFGRRSSIFSSGRRSSRNRSSSSSSRGSRCWLSSSSSSSRCPGGLGRPEAAAPVEEHVGVLGCHDRGNRGRGHRLVVKLAPLPIVGRPRVGSVVATPDGAVVVADTTEVVHGVRGIRSRHKRAQVQALVRKRDKKAKLLPPQQILERKPLQMHHLAQTKEAGKKKRKSPHPIDERTSKKKKKKKKKEGRITRYGGRRQRVICLVASRSTLHLLQNHSSPGGSRSSFWNSSKA